MTDTLPEEQPGGVDMHIDLTDAEIWAPQSKLDAANTRITELEARLAAAEDVAEAYYVELRDAAARTAQIETLEAQLAEANARAEGFQRTNGEMEALFNAVMKGIREETEGVLGYEQMCSAPHAVHRLAQRFAEEKAQREKAEAEAERLKLALEEYANADNWMVYSEEGKVDEYTWRMDKPKVEGNRVDAGWYIGPQIAQAALRAPARPEDPDAGLVWPENETRRVKAKPGETYVRPPFVICDEAARPAESEETK